MTLLAIGQLVETDHKNKVVLDFEIPTGRLVLRVVVTGAIEFTSKTSLRNVDMTVQKLKY